MGHSHCNRAGAEVFMDAKRNSPAAGQQRFNEFLAYDVLAWRPDHAEVRMPVRPVHTNYLDVVHGGVLASLLDVALGLAGSYGHPAGAAASLTLSLSTAFVKGARGAALRCTARRVGGGTRVFVARGEITDEAGDVVATGEGVFRYVAERAAAEPGS